MDSLATYSAYSSGTSVMSQSAYHQRFQTQPRTEHWGESPRRNTYNITYNTRNA